MKHPKIPEQLLVFAGSLLMFLLTLAANFSGPHDSIGYLNGIIKGGENLSHPHHLLYHYAAWYWLQFTQAIFPGIKDYYLVEAFTAVCGSVSMTIVYSFFRWRFNWKPWPSVVFSSVIAFSYGMWFYSANIEVYAPAMMFLLASLYKLTSPSFSKKDLWLVAVLHCLAILFHQLHILFALVIIYILWSRRQQLAFMPSFIAYAITGLVLVGGTYFFMGWVVAGQDSLEQWTGWMQGYTKHQDYWQMPGVKTPFYVFTGFTHAFVGGHFVFRLPGIDSYFEKLQSVHSLHDEIFLARHISQGTAIVLSLLTLLLAATMLVLIVRFIRKYKTVRKTWPSVIPSLVVCGAVYSAFFCVWMPEILEFWIFQTVLLWLLLLGTLTVTGFPFGLRHTAVGLICSITLFIVNYFGSIRWLQDLDHDWYYLKVRPVENAIKENDVVLLQQGWILKDFLEYFTKSNVTEVPANSQLRPAVDSIINSSFQRGGRLFLYPDVNSMSERPETSYVDSLMRLYSKDIHLLHPNDPEILIIKPVADTTTLPQDAASDRMP
ncbi:glycosyltransferase family 39 protein [Pseudoflavitalea rhizosphaerae]|uniref:glycosyltransferase family 39 protein n=1 Tax=Pseudoflavitalea rhizosphaerae TaxID=1884793 RepID=UPI000F8CCD51|nr:glycosyltransferase family 39 protein [Pseudoflavitalea rhizosphaerae]